MTTRTRASVTGADQVADLRRALDDFDACRGRATDWGTRLAHQLRAGARLLVAGNGGSAAQAQHLTAEVVGRFRDDRPAFSGICLSSETSTLTAVANDYGFEELFARQVAAHGRRGDVLLAMSTSGRSPNLLRACEVGRAGGLLVWAMTGPADSPLSSGAHETLRAPSSRASTVQEMHLLAIHIMCAAFDATLQRDRSA